MDYLFRKIKGNFCLRVLPPFKLLQWRWRELEKGGIYFCGVKAFAHYIKGKSRFYGNQIETRTVVRNPFISNKFPKHCTQNEKINLWITKNNNKLLSEIKRTFLSIVCKVEALFKIKRYFTAGLQISGYLFYAHYLTTRFCISKLII